MVFFFICDYVGYKKQRIRTHPQLGISSDYLCLAKAYNIDTVSQGFKRFHFFRYGFIFGGRVSPGSFALPSSVATTTEISSKQSFDANDLRR